MSKRYSTWKKKFKLASGEEKELYYACSKRGQVIGFSELTELITEASSLTSADVAACLIALSENISRELAKGNSVRLDNIGTFSVAVSSKGYATPQEITADRVKATKVAFKPDKKLRSTLSSTHFSSFDKEVARIKGLQTNEN